MRDAYHTEGRTDLKVIQASALGCLENPRFPGYPDETTVHHHPKADSCAGMKHEHFLFKSENRLTCEKCGSPAHRDDAMERRCNSCENLVRQCICPPKIERGDILLKEYAEDKFDAGTG